MYFVRHGESVANLSDRNGDKRPDDADRLSELGWEQARGLGRRLEGEGLELIVASPMTRAQETAQGIAEVLGLPVETDEDLFEVRQSDAFYAASPDYGDTGTLTLDADRAAGLRGAGRGVVRRHRRPRAARDGAARRARHRAAHRRGQPPQLPALLPRRASSSATTLTPAMVPGLYQAGHANTGITIFEHVASRVFDGVDLPGWVLTTWNDRAHL